MMPIGDPRDGFFYTTLTLMIDSYNIIPEQDRISGNNSKYNLEMPQSQTADKPMDPRGRATQPSRDTRKSK